MSSSWTQKANKGTGGNFEKAPAGNHPAVLVAIIDMGTQENEYNGESKSQHRAYFIWELVTEKMSGTKDRNHLIGIDLTVSLNEKAKLRQWIEARTGKKMPDDLEYDISKELGQKCLINIVEKNNYPKIAGISALPKSLPCPEPQNTPIAISLEEFRTGAKTIPDWVPFLYGEHLAEHIKRCEELTKKGGKEMDFDELEGAMAGKSSQPHDDPIPY